MKLSASKSLKRFNGYDLNIKGPEIKEQYPSYFTIKNLSKDDLLKLSAFCISLARNLPEQRIELTVVPTWLDDWM